MEVNKIYEGDVLEVLKTFPDESIDLVLTDPPYNISQKERKIDRSKIQNRKIRRLWSKRQDTTSQLNYDFGKWDYFENTEIFLKWTEKWVRECFRVLKPTGNFISFFSKSEISYFETIIKKYAHVRQTLVWCKTNPVPQIFKVGFMSGVEFLSWATKNKGAGHTFNYKLGQSLNYIITPICQGNERTEHPTQKPEKVINWLMEYLSNPNDIILDPFLGSGTTAVVAKKSGRKYLGIELNPAYIKIAEKRLAQQTIWN